MMKTRMQREALPTTSAVPDGSRPVDQAEGATPRRHGHVPVYPPSQTATDQLVAVKVWHRPLPMKRAGTKMKRTMSNLTKTRLGELRTDNGGIARGMASNVEVDEERQVDGGVVDE